MQDSWNNVSNSAWSTCFASQDATHIHVLVIYIDQPIGTGFSYGTDTVNSTEAAAPFVWKAFQILFESQLFSQYASREYVP